jgi:hypothetical protein
MLRREGRRWRWYTPRPTAMNTPNALAVVRPVGPRATAPRLVRLLLLAGVLLWPGQSSAQITAVARPGATPAWDKGLLPITAESYYHAISCGKQGGEDPPCVFWDTGLCKNPDFTLTFYSAYKQVAYQVWTAVRRKQPAPQPSYQSAQRTRVTVGIEPVPGAKNPLTNLVLTRGGKAVPAVDRYVADGGGRFTFDYAAWAPTGSVTLQLVGQARSISCVIPPGVLRQFR